MRLISRSRVALATAGLAALTCVAIPSGSVAQAAGPTGWRIFFRQHGPADVSFYTAVATAAGNAWAVGQNGAAEPGSPIAAFWHNGKWTATPMPVHLGILEAVSADSLKDAWAVSEFNVLHWHNGKWTVSKSWHASQFLPLVTGITALSPTNVWVFGSRSKGIEGRGTWHFDGHRWTRITSGHGREITIASAVSPTDLWAIGRTNATNDSILHLVHGRWALVTGPALKGLQFGAIYAQSAASIWVTASPGGGTTGSRLLHFDGHHWTSRLLPWKLPVTSLSFNALGAMSSDGHGGVWISARFANSPTWLVHFNAGRWSRVRIGASFVLGLARIPCSRSLWATGESAQGHSGSDALIWAFGRVPKS